MNASDSDEDLEDDQDSDSEDVDDDDDDDDDEHDSINDSKTVGKVYAWHGTDFCEDDNKIGINLCDGRLAANMPMIIQPYPHYV